MCCPLSVLHLALDLIRHHWRLSASNVTTHRIALYSTHENFYIFTSKTVCVVFYIEGITL